MVVLERFFDALGLLKWVVFVPLLNLDILTTMYVATWLGCRFGILGYILGVLAWHWWLWISMFLEKRRRQRIRKTRGWETPEGRHKIVMEEIIKELRKSKPAPA